MAEDEQRFLQYADWLLHVPPFLCITVTIRETVCVEAEGGKYVKKWWEQKNINLWTENKMKG